ncbi:MAG: hypothetical protein MMC23_003410 [Stictis urceolatum]|nr:hypothetical protein [Stictis urceolata]
MLPKLAFWLCLFTSFLALVSDRVSGDADFESVYEFLREDHSGKGGDSNKKYFHESTFHPHYDGRFATKTLPDAERRINLTALVKSYLATMKDLGAETWLMHGTLIGWWWNRKILPWDSDIDVQMTFDSMAFLHNYYQLYVFHWTHPDIPGGRDYMLEINEQFDKDNENNRYNAIDGRWIDMQTGIFIDITAVKPNDEMRAKGQLGALKCKDNHKYNESDIFPLRDSTFEGVDVKIPYEYAWLLEEEYTKRALTKDEFEGHKFNPTSLEWEPIKGKPAQYPNSRKGRPGNLRGNGF